MGYERTDDPLARWLDGDGSGVLDALTRDSIDVIAVVDPNLRIRYLNRTGPSLTREQVVGKTVVDLVPPDTRDATNAVYRRVLATGKGETYTAMYRVGEDVHIWDVRVGPIRSDGVVIGLIANSTEVTEQRRADADRDRFFELSLDMLVVATPDGCPKRVNPALGKVLGHEVTDFIGKPFNELVHPDDRAQTAKAFGKAAQRQPVTEFENRVRRHDGTYRVFSWRGVADPVTGDVYAVARDVTDHRRAVARLTQAQKMEAIGQLAGGIAHDFNNLMQAVLANADLATRIVAPSSAVAKYVREIASAGRRAADLTKQLLAFSRRQPSRPMLVDLNALLRDLETLLRRLLPENIGIDISLSDDLASVHADRSQLEQVIVNLCVNARDAMKDGGRLSIETTNVQIGGTSTPGRKPGRYVRLRVADTGTGMSREVRERAFEPFFTTKGDHQGTGLGLAIVYGIVQQHGGTLHVDSAPGAGTAVAIELPAVARRATSDRAVVEAPAPGGNETILVAEDEALVRRAVIQILESAGYRTIAAVDGLEAVRLLDEHAEPVHLALLDVAMPRLGGPEAWAQMRDKREHLRVLFASGHASDRSLERLPPDADVLEKPFRPDVLLRRVRETLDG